MGGTGIWVGVVSVLVGVVTVNVGGASVSGRGQVKQWPPWTLPCTTLPSPARKLLCHLGHSCHLVVGRGTEAWQGQIKTPIAGAWVPGLGQRPMNLLGLPWGPGQNRGPPAEGPTAMPTPAQTHVLDSPK